ncbi:hypothetical protein SGPA1_21605 [Streptomyces misionensis JCM 4497]
MNNLPPCEMINGKKFGTRDTARQQYVNRAIPSLLRAPTQARTFPQPLKRTEQGETPRPLAMILKWLASSRLRIPRGYPRSAG